MPWVHVAGLSYLDAENGPVHRTSKGWLAKTLMNCAAWTQMKPEPSWYSCSYVEEQIKKEIPKRPREWCDCRAQRQLTALLLDKGEQGTHCFVCAAFGNFSGFNICLDIFLHNMNEFFIHQSFEGKCVVHVCVMQVICVSCVSCVCVLDVYVWCGCMHAFWMWGVCGGSGCWEILFCLFPQNCLNICSTSDFSTFICGAGPEKCFLFCGESTFLCTSFYSQHSGPSSALKCFTSMFLSKFGVLDPIFFHNYLIFINNWRLPCKTARKILFQPETEEAPRASNDSKQ